MKRFLFHIALLVAILPAHAQDTTGGDIVHYSGHTLSNPDYHHGQLVPAVGVHSRQVLRANREHPELAEGSGFTYNHAPMLAFAGVAATRPA